MATTFSIRFVDSNGYGISNGSAVVRVPGFFGGEIRSHTDQDGWAEFTVDVDGPIYINEASLKLAPIGMLYEVECDFSMEDGDKESLTISDL